MTGSSSLRVFIAQAIIPFAHQWYHCAHLTKLKLDTIMNSYQCFISFKLALLPSYTTHPTPPTIARQKPFAEDITSESNSRREIRKQAAATLSSSCASAKKKSSSILVNVFESLLLYLRGFSSSILPELFFICHCQPQAYSTWSYVSELSSGTDSDITAFPDVLVIPTRPVPRIADLNGTKIASFSAILLIGKFVASELVSLMHSVQRVGAIIERAYGADALTVACQASSHFCLFKMYFSWL